MAAHKESDRDQDQDDDADGDADDDNDNSNAEVPIRNQRKDPARDTNSTPTSAATRALSGPSSTISAAGTTSRRKSTVISDLTDGLRHIGEAKNTRQIVTRFRYRRNQAP